MVTLACAGGIGREGPAGNGAAIAVGGDDGQREGRAGTPVAGPAGRSVALSIWPIWTVTATSSPGAYGAPAEST